MCLSLRSKIEENEEDSQETQVHAGLTKYAEMDDFGKVVSYIQNYKSCSMGQLSWRESSAANGTKDQSFQAL